MIDKIKIFLYRIIILLMHANKNDIYRKKSNHFEPGRQFAYV